jgi:HD-GYP domain-containing protein (c-di-GMP phosphodiesterase class II)
MTSSIVSPILLDQESCRTERLVHASSIRFSQIMSALSVALDITQGHKQGHCMRSCLIGMRIANVLKLSSRDCSALFYALLLKDLGCSSNAAKFAYLFGGDDLQIKHRTRLIDWTSPIQCLKHCWTNAAPDGNSFEKLTKVAKIVSAGAEAGRKISEIRCDRGAEIAQMLRQSDATVTAIRDLDEHWNGGGNPKRLRGEEISLLGRICGLAQCVEVFYFEFGLSAAGDMARKRRGKWFDPTVVDAFLSFECDQPFWSSLLSADLISQLNQWEPEEEIMTADEEAIDSVAEAFARVVDAKSPWTFLHSNRVADIAVGIASQFDMNEDMLRDIRRAGLLHDIGKLGVSNMILDKPGRPTEKEFAEIRKHPEYSYRILKQISAFGTLAEVAGGHHERLDGRGYFRGIHAEDISLPTRVLTVADIYEALTAKRPYRDELDREKSISILTNEIGKGVDGECVKALQCWLDRNDLETERRRFGS